MFDLFSVDMYNNINSHIQAVFVLKWQDSNGNSHDNRIVVSRANFARLGNPLRCESQSRVPRRAYFV
jgi:hypothetical protein